MGGLGENEGPHHEQQRPFFVFLLFTDSGVVPMGPAGARAPQIFWEVLLFIV